MPHPPRLLRILGWAGLVVLGLTLRLVGAATLPLSGDEAYHWEWSRHLAGAYYDHPGMTAWLIWFGELLLPGGGELAVRLPAMLSLAIAALLARLLARDVAVRCGAPSPLAGRAGWLAAGLVFFTPLPAAMSVYMSTDPPLQPLWLGAVWCGFRALTGGSTAAWLACGACLGLAVSTKLLSLGLVFALGFALLATREGRAWLRRPQPWLALLALGVMAAPMLWWNATHDWMTFRFNFAIRQREQVASPWHPLVFLGGQALVLTPGFAVLGLLACIWAARQRDFAVRVVAWTALLTLGGFAMISLRRRIGVHWAAPAWLTALALLAVVVTLQVAFMQRRASRAAWRWSWRFSHAALALTYLYVLLPMPLGKLELFAGQPRKILSELRGWPELGAAVAAARTDLAASAPPGAAPPIVLSDQYGMCAAVAFYTPSRPPVHLWSVMRNHGRNYQYWDDWAALRGRDAVFTKKRPLEDWERNLLAMRFASVGPVETVAVTLDGAPVREFYLVRCRQYDGVPPFPAVD